MLVSVFCRGAPMKRINSSWAFRAASLAVCLIPTVQARAEPEKLTTIAPVFSQLLVISQPTTLVPAFEKTVGDRYIREAVLKGETLEHWTQMLTVTGARGLAADPQITPEVFAGLLANGFKKSCPETFASLPLGRLHVGKSEGFAAVAGCGSYESNEGAKSETALIIAIRGEKDYYTIQWADRAPPSDKAPTIDKATWIQRLHDIGPVRLCPIVAGEKAPYPSCIGK